MVIRQLAVVRSLRRLVVLCPAAAILASLIGFPVSLTASRGQPSVTLDTLQAEGLPLQAILNRATVVFVGTVRSVVSETQNVTPGSDVTTKVRVTTFSDVEVLRPRREMLPMLRMAQYDVGSAAGLSERVLWLVEGHGNSFKGPVGGQSGHFSITTATSEICAPARQCEVAENLAGNRGLFGSGSIWSAFNEAEVRAKLERMHLSPERIWHLTRFGSAPWQQGPIPLDLLRALVS